VTGPPPGAAPAQARSINLTGPPPGAAPAQARSINLTGPPPNPLKDRFLGTEWTDPDRREEEAILALGPAAAVAALSAVLGPERAARLDQSAAARLAGVTVVLENLYDPHNGAAVLRSCEAMGLLSVHVVESAERFRAARKVTQGCDKWLEVARHPSAEDCARALRARGFRLYAAVPGAALSLERIDPLVPAAFLLGNEHAGLSGGARALCDEEFAIPLYGLSQSLNLSVATALVIHGQSERRRRALGRAGDLDGEALLRLRARYYARDVRGAEAIVRHHLHGQGTDRSG
jgi:tRNA (guanosine-2'-O-)-methyltransferase